MLFGKKNSFWIQPSLQSSISMQMTMCVSAFTTPMFASLFSFSQNTEVEAFTTMVTFITISCLQPLNTADESSWNRFFIDKDLETEIEKDVRRTFPHLHFFNQDTKGNKRHYKAIKRLLFIYAKLNPGIGYVQGTNR